MSLPSNPEQDAQLLKILQGSEPDKLGQMGKVIGVPFPHTSPEKASELCNFLRDILEKRVAKAAEEKKESSEPAELEPHDALGPKKGRVLDVFLRVLENREKEQKEPVEQVLNDLEKIDQALFQVRKIHVSDLPTIDIKGRFGSTGYIDFLKISDMPQGADLARFVDDHGRNGVALRIQNADATLDGVIAIFQRYTGGDFYVSGLNWQPKLEHHKINDAYNAIHDPHKKHGMACPTCPKMAVEIIRGEDLCFRLANDNKPKTETETTRPDSDNQDQTKQLESGELTAIVLAFLL